MDWGQEDNLRASDGQHSQMCFLWTLLASHTLVPLLDQYGHDIMQGYVPSKQC